jgi:hypothetical protein
MGTRSGYIFEYSHFLGRANERLVRLLLYRHDDGYPEAMVPLILRHWKIARNRHAKLPPPSGVNPQISQAQILAGLLLADVKAKFELVSHREDLHGMHIEYFYSFKQTEAGDDTLILSIRQEERVRKLFNGGFHKLTEYRKRM